MDVYLGIAVCEFDNGCKRERRNLKGDQTNEICS